QTLGFGSAANGFKKRAMSDPSESPRDERPSARRTTAVAVRESEGDGGLPRIVAKGHGTLGEQILALAFANDVRVREDPNLVEVLEAIEVDCEIPFSALAAVAEILTYVYRANQTLALSEHHGRDARTEQLAEKTDERS
ncbi:MAG: EscU/YscU/HrcU family type III secretion system export apparatus switch protein, partial [Alphaproteobacteria bacterium]